MNEQSLARATGGLMILSGAANVAFWILAWRIGSFVGAAAVLDPLWAPSQALHLTASILGAIGLAGLFAVLRRAIGAGSALSFALALVGALCYFADGVIAFSIFPAVAQAAPTMVAASGIMNGPPLLFTFIAFSVMFMIGYLALSAALARTRMFPLGAIGLFALGAVISNLPPGPVPTALIEAGGVVFGAGAIWLGLVVMGQGRARARAEGAALPF